MIVVFSFILMLNGGDLVDGTLTFKKDGFLMLHL